MIKKGLETLRPGVFPYMMHFIMILGCSFNKVLHTDFLLSANMKIVHGRKAKTIRQFVMILPSELINHKKISSFTLGVI